MPHPFRNLSCKGAPLGKPPTRLGIDQGVPRVPNSLPAIDDIHRSHFRFVPWVTESQGNNLCCLHLGKDIYGIRLGSLKIGCRRKNLRTQWREGSETSWKPSYKSCRKHFRENMQTLQHCSQTPGKDLCFECKELWDCRVAQVWAERTCVPIIN